MIPRFKNEHHIPDLLRKIKRLEDEVEALKESLKISQNETRKALRWAARGGEDSEETPGE